MTYHHPIRGRGPKTECPTVDLSPFRRGIPATQIITTPLGTITITVGLDDGACHDTVHIRIEPKPTNKGRTILVRKGSKRGVLILQGGRWTHANADKDDE